MRTLQAFWIWLKGLFARAPLIKPATLTEAYVPDVPHETKVLLPDGRIGVIDHHRSDGTFAVRVGGEIVFVTPADLQHP